MSADPVEVWVTTPEYDGQPATLSFTGTFDCSDFGTTSAACQTGFSNSTGTIEAGGRVMAQASFGSASGSASGGGDIPAGNMYYLASFANDIVVTGGSGKGTLITQYQINGGSIQYGDPTTQPNIPLPSPSFAFVQGADKEDIDTNLTNANSFINETLDITSPFQFGTPFAFGAETQTSVDTYFNAFRGSNASASSSIQLAGFTVLDAAGNVVADAQIVPGRALGTGIFTPEPFSGSLALLGFAALVWPLARARRNK